MYFSLLALALASAPLAAAHGKIAVVTGNMGGNGTGLGIKGGVVPGPGRNKVTEVDTTVFGRRNIMTDGLGKTPGQGKNRAEDLAAAMAQSGSTLPQVSATNGTISGVFHIVTSDGAGPIKAVLDPTGTGKFSQGVMLETMTQVPGRGGNIRKGEFVSQSIGGGNNNNGNNGNGNNNNGNNNNNNNNNGNNNNKRDADEDEEEYTGVTGMLLRIRDVLTKRRATNINEDYPMAFSVPAGTKCTGSMAGQQNVCLVKIANSNRAGPFGGVIAVQMADGTTATPARDVKEAKPFKA